ncbi:MAG: potassium channel family protein [Thermoplasmataceae archaeon]
MVLFPVFLKRFRRVVRMPLLKPAAASLSIIAYGVFSEYLLQRGNPQSGIHSLFTSLWWVMQTVTTVGYGDTPVVGLYARINGIFIMVAGIGSVGFLLANLGSNLIDNRLARKIGEARTRMKQHIIICNFNDQAAEVARDILKEDIPVLILSQTKPRIEDPNIDYVNGSSLNVADLDKAGITKCKTAIILADRKNEGEDVPAVDAKTIVSIANIKRINPQIYVIAELLSRDNENTARNLGADEIIVKGNVSSLLISNAVLNPGISKIYGELLRTDGKMRFEEVPVDDSFRGKATREFHDYLEKNGKVLIAVRKGDDIIIRPPLDSTLDCEFAILISQNDR